MEGYSHLSFLLSFCLSLGKQPRYTETMAKSNILLLPHYFDVVASKIQVLGKSGMLPRNVRL